jgi:hypothetical protein
VLLNLSLPTLPISLEIDLPQVVFVLNCCGLTPIVKLALDPVTIALGPAADPSDPFDRPGPTSGEIVVVASFVDLQARDGHSHRSKSFVYMCVPH